VYKPKPDLKFSQSAKNQKNELEAIEIEKKGFNRNDKKATISYFKLLGNSFKFQIEEFFKNSIDGSTIRREVGYRCRLNLDSNTHFAVCNFQIHVMSSFYWIRDRVHCQHWSLGEILNQYLTITGLDTDLQNQPIIFPTGML
jgi:hypothetical protein